MKKSVSLVLASGGARGMAHIGVIEELERQNFKIDSIAGCSFGAVVGAIYAAGNLKPFKEWLLKLDAVDVFRLMDFTISSHGFIKGKKVFDTIKPFFGDQNIEDLPIPFAAVAVEINERKEVVFKKGNLFDAVRASIAIPSIIEPHIIGKLKLVDGSIMNPLPLDLVERNGEDLLVAVNLNATIPYKRRRRINFVAKRRDKRSILNRIEFYQRWAKLFPKDIKKDSLGHFSLLNRTYDLMQSKISNLMIEKYQPDILVNISKYASSTFDFFKAREIIQIGREAFNEALADYDVKMINRFRKLFRPKTLITKIRNLGK